MLTAVAICAAFVASCCAARSKNTVIKHPVIKKLKPTNSFFKSDDGREPTVVFLFVDNCNNDAHENIKNVNTHEMAVYGIPLTTANILAEKSGYKV